MKKIVLFVAAAVAIAFASCNACQENAEEAVVEEVAVEEVAEVADSIVEVVEEVAEVADSVVAE
ncbi:MAG: hypothetical protein IKB64_04245 [Paludibacteraceae bacterium]|nr:hypothetical protein [Paludibacteraceae bacterium]MBR2492660.1 hypothetical protein [Paludibacteraceae bacterium]MBR3872075.1 hypothetical protein [Paludibacteraceae bacterium]MBR6686665.1 hypothetical protein [Paludibacteraceae bacterium]